MKIIVAGAGEVGTHLAKMLSSEFHDITVIDPDAESLKSIDSNLDLLTITGSATSFETLKEAADPVMVNKSRFVNHYRICYFFRNIKRSKS